MVVRFYPRWCLGIGRPYANSGLQVLVPSPPTKCFFHSQRYPTDVHIRRDREESRLDERGIVAGAVSVLDTIHTCTLTYRNSQECLGARGASHPSGTLGGGNKTTVEIGIRRCGSVGTSLSFYFTFEHYLFHKIARTRSQE